MDYLINTEKLKKLKPKDGYKISSSVKTFKYPDDLPYYRSVVTVEDLSPCGFEWGYKVVIKGAVSLTKWGDITKAHNEAFTFASEIRHQLTIDTTKAKK